MKIIKYVLFGILGLLIVLIGLMFILPQTYHVERSVEIDAPVKLVKEQSVEFSNFTLWSPWSKLDPEMNIKYSGIEGEIGSKYEWSGNEDVGKGSQEITNISDDRVDIALTFIEPWEDKANTYFAFESLDKTTKVTWGMDGEMKRPMNLMSLFMNMEKVIGNDYEEGLNALKERCEKMASEITWRGYKVEEENLPKQTLVIKKATISMAEMQGFFDTGFNELYSAAKPPEGQNSFGIYYEWDEENQTTTMAVGVPSEEDLEGFETQSIGGDALKIVYNGDYEGSIEAHLAMDDFIKANKLEHEFLVVEEYVIGPMNETDTSKWKTNIYYMF